jgi:hypothetical protein
MARELSKRFKMVQEGWFLGDTKVLVGGGADRALLFRLVEDAGED